MGRRSALSANDEFEHLLHAHGLWGFVREVRFRATRWWRFDFGMHAIKLAIEIEGGTWGYRDPKTGEFKKGRHATGKGMADDMEKYNAAVEEGWVVLRYTPEMARTQEAIDQIRTIIAAREAMLQG